MLTSGSINLSFGRPEKVPRDFELVSFTVINPPIAHVVTVLTPRPAIKIIRMLFLCFDSKGELE